MDCPSCGHSECRPLYRADNVPAVSNALATSLEAATAVERASIRLAACKRCSLIFNAAFDPDRVHYNGNYDASLHFSRTFREYAEALTDWLIVRHGLRGKRVVEIGCGDGRFLGLLCRKGGNVGTGFDPAATKPADESAVRIERGAFDPRRRLDADFVCCRQVLEHVGRPADWLGQVRSALPAGRAVPVFFEVPNGLHMLRRMAIWDILYEHACYFVPTALEAMFRRCGFEPTGLAESYHGQFLTIEAVAGGANDSTGTAEAAVLQRQTELGRLLDRFALGWPIKVGFWRRILRQLQAQGRRTVVWGGGSKGIGFLNTMGPDAAGIECVVDQNPGKAGKFIPGTGQAVVGPDFLREYRPGAIIVMNPAYADEIHATVTAMDLTAEYLMA